MAYQERTYRRQVISSDLVFFEVVEAETDLFISAQKDLSEQARQIVLEYRKILSEYLRRHPRFKDSLKPCAAEKNAPGFVEQMAEAGAKAGVGPMAAVAGAFAEYVGKDLLKSSREVIVENGGDNFVASAKPRRIAIFAGSSPLSMKLGIEINPSDTPLGVCTSSGTVGHSLSFGKADAVTVVSKSTLLADAAATAIGNIVKTPADIQRGLDLAKEIGGLMGVIIIVGDRLGARGNLELINIV